MAVQNCCKNSKKLFAWRSGLERPFYDDHDRKVHDSTPHLLDKMLHDDYLASSKLKKSEES